MRPSRHLIPLLLAGALAGLSTAHADEPPRSAPLPFRFALVEGRMMVLSNDGQPDAPPPGSEVTAINGEPVPWGLSRLDQAIAPADHWPAPGGAPERWSIQWKRLGDSRLTQSDLAPAATPSPPIAAVPGVKRRQPFDTVIDLAGGVDGGDRTMAAGAARLGAALSGAWAGTLDYRDYGSDRRVILPTRLTASAGLVPVLAFTFDDGPGKTVHSRETWSLDPTTWCIAETASHCYRVMAFRAGPGPDDITLVADGAGEENGRPVSLRLVLARRGATLSFSTTSAQAGQLPLLRHAYWLTKTGPA
ncbi:hypothetical protein [Nitrospirillum amazonense]|uniref:hypothetical protein n=1 Tax=Nitrospirillum amazonense TaxID=28077 RepID=UPI002412667F|nr:hypothetical protein [Nitrospirillum amazonense]MDG3442234.1 hypothetical protein [Nitrospirillum amazonense]